MGLLDKDNPCDDFYDNKHLNSDLICTNFTELTDEEYYEALKWANKTLMKNYYDKQKISTVKQIDHLYDNRDTSFRGFRHGSGNAAGETSVKDSFRNVESGQKVVNKAKLVNYENTFNRDADASRFSNKADNTGKSRKSLRSFDEYLESKRIRLEQRKIKKSEVEIQSPHYDSTH